MRHLKYLRYLIRHKWFVMLACWSRGLIWRGIIHDLSKFRPSEWFPYANYFYGPKYSDEECRQAMRTVMIDLPSQADRERAFNKAWLLHQHRNDHHWQHWVLRNDDGTTECLEMPRKVALEMLSDWDGAGRAIVGKDSNTREWYLKNRVEIMLHPETRALVHKELRIE